MGEKGYNFQTQEKLKSFCKENRINLELDSEGFLPLIEHDRTLEIINYCSLGDYEKAVSLVMIVSGFLEDRRIEYLPKVEFLFYFLRTYFIIERGNLEFGGSDNKMPFINNFLENMHVQIRGLQDSEEIEEFMNTQCGRFKTVSLAIAEVFKLLSPKS